MVIKLIPGRWGIPGALLIFVSSVVVARDLATIETHTQRYGSYIAISAYEDPLVSGVTCYVSESQSDGALGSGRVTHGADQTASCHQTGNIRIAETVPKQAQVFTAESDPAFDSLHIIRVLDAERHSLVYFTYNEDEVAGDLPGRIDVIRLPAGPRMPTR
ncbi:CreA family protein [Paraburkholderia phytofirmans]|uniref:CreA family protein n=1 Tax=Paraburkholderia phytofirmans (strain DSM 17436 / LMG 22146 / PsJN) TaxID=398527 RepID=B2TG90_PARPJ|nr:CreA family protein [Paraburkholderia phytofirmans]ACD19964.1 CreA family protein [Paraburkholderia phytofirmans PsJN]